jgi:hypothetical protein
MRKVVLKTGFKFHMMQVLIGVFLISLVVVISESIDRSLSNMLYLMLSSVFLSILVMSLSLFIANCYWCGTSCNFTDKLTRFFAYVSSIIFTISLVVILSMMICSSTEPSAGCAVSDTVVVEEVKENKESD